MASYTFDDIPNTILADIFAHFDFSSNWLYRRVSVKWGRLLISVFGINHFAVSIAKLQRKVWFTTEEVHGAYAFERTLSACAEEWFASQKGVSVQRNIFFYGRGEPRFQIHLTLLMAARMQECMVKMELQPRWWMWANLRLTAHDLIYMRVYNEHRPTMFYIPPTCRLLLKDCYIDGVDWLNLGCTAYRSSLFCIPITDIEDVNVGAMNTGQLTEIYTIYNFGDGEETRFGAELLRLGRKYAKAMNAIEREVLHHSLHYQYFKMAPEDVQGILKLHEASVGNQALLPGSPNDCLQRLVCQWKDIKLNPLTERLLAAVCATFV